MIFRTHRPALPLQNYVDRFIYFEGIPVAHSMDRFLPDGNTEIIIDLTESPKPIYDNASLQVVQTCRRAWVSGVRTKPITIPAGDKGSMLIVLFKRGGAFPFYKFPMHELKDSVLEADLVFGTAFNTLRSRIQESPSIREKFQLVEDFLTTIARGKFEPDHTAKCIEFAIARFSNGNERIEISAISDKIGYSQKHLIDIFKAKVGISPKSYLGILRFQRVIREIEIRSDISWNQVALEAGYYDQSHFINDFKRFSGFTPNEYVKRKSHLLNYVPVK